MTSSTRWRTRYDVHSYRVEPVPATRTLAEGDAIDLGDRCFAVLFPPYHSPGSIGLWEEAGLLFPGERPGRRRRSERK